MSVNINKGKIFCGTRSLVCFLFVCEKLRQVVNTNNFLYPHNFKRPTGASSSNMQAGKRSCQNIPYWYPNVINFLQEWAKHWYSMFIFFVTEKVIWVNCRHFCNIFNNGIKTICFNDYRSLHKWEWNKNSLRWTSLSDDGKLPDKF